MDMHFEGIIFQTHAAELARRIERAWPPFAVLDVRPAADFERGSISGSRSFQLPVNGKGALPEGTDAATEFFVVGRDPEDREVRRVSDHLRRAGARRVVEVPGGLYEWRQLGLPLTEAAGQRAA